MEKHFLRIHIRHTYSLHYSIFKKLCIYQDFLRPLDVWHEKSSNIIYQNRKKCTVWLEEFYFEIKKIHTSPACFFIPIIFSDLNSNCSNICEKPKKLTMKTTNLIEH